MTTIQTDIVSKARDVVENARKQAYILIKAREANLRATEEAKRAQEAAYQAVFELKRSGADAQAKTLA